MLRGCQTTRLQRLGRCYIAVCINQPSNTGPSRSMIVGQYSPFVGLSPKWSRGPRGGHPVPADFDQSSKPQAIERETPLTRTRQRREDRNTDELVERMPMKSLPALQPAIHLSGAEPVALPGFGKKRVTTRKRRSGWRSACEHGPHLEHGAHRGFALETTGRPVDSGRVQQQPLEGSSVIGGGLPNASTS